MPGIIAMIAQSSLEADFIGFFRNEPGLDRIRFRIAQHYFNEQIFRVHIPKMFEDQKIRFIFGKLPDGTVAVYHGYAEAARAIQLEPAFSLNSVRNKGFALHESCHAFIDEQNIGYHSQALNEAACYIAEECYKELAGGPIFPNTTPYRKAARLVARNVLANRRGSYFVGHAEAMNLIKVLKSDPFYAKTTFLDDTLDH